MHLLVTQPETVDGAEMEALRRLPVDTFLQDMGVTQIKQESYNHAGRLVEFDGRFDNRTLDLVHGIIGLSNNEIKYYANEYALRTIPEKPLNLKSGSLVRVKPSDDNISAQCIGIMDDGSIVNTKMFSTQIIIQKTGNYAFHIRNLSTVKTIATDDLIDYFEILEKGSYAEKSVVLTNTVGMYADIFTPVWNDYSPTLVSGKYIDGNGNIVSGSSSIAFVTDPIPVKGGDVFKISSIVGNGNCLYSISDENGNIVDYLTNDSGKVKTYLDYELTIPYNGKTLTIINSSETQLCSYKKIVGYILNTQKDKGVIRWDENQSLTDKQKAQARLNIGVYEFVSKYAEIIWAVLGDSITEKTIRANTAYYDHIKNDLGLKEIVNYGVSGTGYLSNYDVNTAFYQRMANIDADSFDVMTIMGSFNDLGSHTGGRALGTKTDYGVDDDGVPTTIASAINNTISTYYALSLKPLGIISPLPYSHDDLTSIAEREKTMLRC